MKNYTSTVNVDTTISRIERALAKAGAVGIAKSYKNGEVVSLRFGLFEIESGKNLMIQVPARIEAVESIMRKAVRHPRGETYRSRSTEERIRDQAARTAWKLVQDWVEVQLTLIEMGQAEAIQVFLPYVHNGKKTFFEALKEGGFKALPEGRP